MDASHQIVWVRRQVEIVCTGLESPTPAVLSDCAGALDAATEALTRAQHALNGKDAELLAETHRLRRALTHARALLQSAWNFHTGWSRILNGMMAGYTAQGEAASRPRHGNICLQG